MATRMTRRRFTADEFHRMGQAGIFTEDDRLELLEGEIVAMTPIGSRHAACVKRLVRLLSARLEGRAILSVQDPVRLGAHSEPQPDLALLRPQDDFYASSHPGPADVLLIIEVADASDSLDRDAKVPLYARAGIPEVWLVSLPTQIIEVYRQPSRQGYRAIHPRARGESVGVAALADLTLLVGEILG